ncbi:MAG: 16S rRNA (adenine(1518)-N(6)/adenine(1519)-N(6))-dimethyltransferase RsmA [Chloroflexaceae bacterium]|nr:16S rRNA (adenine(1518)-N(6)/adenine(1519)-N(6))-dimethyltransferase RsmA [Chloroflexaceae bacterium]
MNPYLSAPSVRAALRALHLHPTRGMGQHFLVDPHALQQIVAAAELAPNDVVVEVGPGLGVLTWELIHRAGQVVAIELDKRLASRLREELVGRTVVPFDVIQGDVLRCPPAVILEQAGVLEGRWSDIQDVSYLVVANLPYAITSPVLRHFLEHSPQPRRIVVLVQWEVAQRITAAPGKLSVLTHAIQMYARPEVVGRVRATSFLPQPAVDSAILRLEVRPAPAVEVDDTRAFFQVIKAGFLHPRKKLSNALPGGLAALQNRVERAGVVAALHTAGVSPDRRAETVTLEEWAAVYAALARDVFQCYHAHS